MEDIPETSELMNKGSSYEAANAEFNAVESAINDAIEKVANGGEVLDGTDIEEAKVTREKLREAKAKAYNEYQAVRKVWMNSLFETYGIDPTEDFSKPLKDMSDETRKYIQTTVKGVAEPLSELQKSLGESGKTLNESPKTFDKIKKFLNDHHTKVMLLSSIFGGVVPGLIASNDTTIFGSNPDAGPASSVSDAIGCYQYNTSDGDIRFLGLCGVKTPSASTCCPPIKNPDKLCTKDSDCDNTNTKPCKTDGDCMTTCNTTTGFCNGQTCDQNTGSCSPCPLPDRSLHDQAKDLAFCLGGDVSAPCPMAKLACAAYDPKTNSGGTCQSCEDASSDSKTCFKTSKSYITIPVCGNADSLIILLSHMFKYKDSWAPTPTPITGKILMILSIIGFIVTIIWYIIYLIKNAKR